MLGHRGSGFRDNGTHTLYEPPYNKVLLSLWVGLYKTSPKIVSTGDGRAIQNFPLALNLRAPNNPWSQYDTIVSQRNTSDEA